MLRVWVQGELRLELDGTPIAPPPSRRARLLLAMLALDRRRHSREALAARLWPGTLDESARANLRTTLARLRRALGAEADRFLDVTRDHAGLAGPDEVWTDVGELERCLADGDLDGALGLYREDLAAGLEDDWVYERRDELRERVSEALARRAAELEEAGELRASIELTRRQAGLDQLAEEAHRELIRRLAAAGDRGAALAVYQRLAERLRAQLRSAPSPATRELADAVRSGRAAEPTPGRAVRPKTSYASCGDLSIAYQTLGDGPFDLVLAVGWTSHLDLQWNVPAWASFLTRLASFSRLIMFDKRGTGLSDPVSEPPTYDERMDDLQAVMDAAGSRRAVLVGYSDGALLAAWFAAAHPERTEALVVWDGFVGFARDELDEKGLEILELQRRVMDDVLDHWGEGRFLDLVSPTAAQDPELRRGWGVFERAALSPAMARMVYRGIERADIRPALPAIRVPTLVIDFTDSVVPGLRGDYLAEHIPGARFVQVEGRDHIPLVGDVTEVAAEIERFLEGRPEASEPDTVLATVLCARIVAGSEKALRSELARTESTLRAELDRFGSRRIERTAEGLLALFDGPTRAIRCAAAIQDADDGSGGRVAIGLHTGEVERTAGDRSALTIEIARQASTLASPGQMLATRTVKDLMAGSRVRFAYPETHMLESVGEAWELYPVVAGRPPDAELPPG